MQSNDRPVRRSARLSGFDYASAGAYFVTICTADREHRFGNIAGGEMDLSDAGRIVCDQWLRSGAIRLEIELDAFVVMPNHVHGIVIINAGNELEGQTSTELVERSGAGTRRAPLRADLASKGSARHGVVQRKPRSLGSFVAGFKAASTREINRVWGTEGESVWQRNYYEHVIRNEADLNRIREYIRTNPLRWTLDRENVRRSEDDPFDIWLDAMNRTQRR